MPSPLNLIARRAGPLGVALTVYDLWRRIPPSQRRQLVNATRTHAPRLAGKAIQRARRPGGPKPKP